MDASPFREQDLDPNVEEFIVGWASEAPSGAKLALLVNLGRHPGPGDESALLRDAVHDFFRLRGAAARRRLRQLMRIGRTSLLVGLVFLALVLLLADFFATILEGQRLGVLMKEGLVICGWVAMWRPLEIFLYDWWPIRAEARMYDRLAAMPVQIAFKDGGEPDTWKQDWPAVLPWQATPQRPPE